MWSEWGQWSACNPDCKQGIRLKRRTNNEDTEGKVQFLESIGCNNLYLESVFTIRNNLFQIKMNLEKVRPALVQASFLKSVEIMLKMIAVIVLISTINATRSAQVFAQMFVTRQK